MAIVLILVTAAACFVGAALMQAPPPALESDEQFALWLDQARLKYGMWTGLFARLEFFNVFSSTWFRGLMVLLAANVLVCSADRTPQVVSLVRRKPTSRVSSAMFARAPLRAATTVDSVDRLTAADHVSAALRRHRFKVRRTDDADVIHLSAEKNKYMRLGTLAHHVGLIVILLGAVWGGRGGFHESQFIIPEGGERAVGHDTGVTIRLTSFIDEYYVGGGGVPKDFRSEIVMIKDGEEVASGTVRVNSPVNYKGLRVHQAFFGPAIVMRVDGPDGTNLFDGPVSLNWSAQDRPAGSFIVPGTTIEAFIIGPASAFIDPVVRPGEIRLEVYNVGGRAPIALENLSQGSAKSIAGLSFSFVRESRFTGLQVVQDPGLPLVWAGSAFAVLGAMAVLSFPHRRLWARIETGDGGVVVQMAAPRERGLPFEYEFKRISQAVAGRLTVADQRKGGV
jgi:cytochrome c biogenesis protein